MIIDNFDVQCVSLMPLKADAPLPVDADGIWTFPFAFQSVKHLSWIPPQGIQTWRGMENHQSLSPLPHE